MRSMLFIASLAMVHLYCTKPQEAVVEQTGSVTQWIVHCDSAWKETERHITIHWCSVSGDDLRYYQSVQNRRDTFGCPSNGYTWFVVGKSDCEVKQTN